MIEGAGRDYTETAHSQCTRRVDDATRAQLPQAQSQPSRPRWRQGDPGIPRARAGPGADDEMENPAWWQPYAGECPGWQAWRGLTGLLYAHKPGSVPPAVVHAENAAALRDQVIQAEGSK
jgi:hypothetical protein